MWKCFKILDTTLNAEKMHENTKNNCKIFEIIWKCSKIPENTGKYGKLFDNTSNAEK